MPLCNENTLYYLFSYSIIFILAALFSTPLPAAGRLLETNSEERIKRALCFLAATAGWRCRARSSTHPASVRIAAFIREGALFSIIDKPDSKSIERNIEAINYFASQVNVPVSLIMCPSANRDTSGKTARLRCDMEPARHNQPIFYSQCDGVECVSVYETPKEHSDDYIYHVPITTGRHMERI